MTEWKFTLAVIVAAAMLASSILPPGGPASLPAAAAPASAGRDAPPMRDPAINYMNKTVLTPTIDGTWGANEWTRAKRYDMSFGGQDQCVMYISFDTTNTRIFIGIDVPVDITQDTNVNENELVQIAIDGENDGKITYKNKDGTPENETGEVMPITYGGSCKDRWAMISGSGTYDAGWLNLNGVDNSIQLWRTQPYYYEASDQMSAGFSGHRFYEYSIDYIHELGTSAGASSIVGINIRVMDGLGDNNPNTWQVRGYLPFNYSTLGGPWAQFAIAQAPLAGIRAPADGRIYYQNETIVLDGSDSTDDVPASLVYAWSFDDGGTAANKTTTHSFATTGQHLITLNVTDADGLTNTTRATVNIRERNVPPVIESFFPGPDPQVNETERMDFGVNVTDENMDVGDRVNITWTIDGVVKKVDVNSWKSNFTVVTQYDGPLSAGTHTIAASVVDSYDIESHDPVVHSWSLSVQNTNRPPLVLASSPDSDIITVPENTAQEFSIEFQDPDNDTEISVVWKLDNRTIPGTRDQPSITYSPDYNSSGVHIIKAVMTDSLGGVTERIWTVTVTNMNRPPRIVSFSPTGDTVQLQEGKTVMLVVSAFDPDGGVPKVEWFNGEDIIEGANGTAYSFKAQYEGPGSSELSPYTITAVITDKEGQKDERSWEIAVDDVNRPPVALIDEPLDDSTFRLGTSIRFRADRSWDPDTVDNSSLSYTWSFDDGSRTSTLPVVNHKYEKTGNYTVRLTVRDRLTSSSVLVSVMVVAPVLSITELSLDPPEGASDGTRVTIQLRVANNGNAMATDVRIKLTLDNVLLATLTIPQIERGDSQDVHWAWPAVAGSHVIRAALEPAADTVIGEGGNSQKEISVKARPGASTSIISLRTGLYIAGGAGAAVLLLVGLAVWSRRRRARQASQAAAPMPPAPAAPSQRITYEQMASAPAPPAPATPLYPQFPGPETAPAPPAYPQFPGPAPQPSAPPAYPQIPGPAASAGPLPPPSGSMTAAAPATGPQPSPFPAPSPPVAPVQPVPPPSAPAPSPAAGPPTQAATDVLTACPVCGEPIEGGWMVCPACSTPLQKEAAAATTPQGMPAAPAGQNAAGPSPEASALASSIAELMQKLNGLAIEGKDVAQAIGMLDIAESFLHTGKMEKAQQYLEKAKTALSEIGN